jgi:hypothetical protein
MEPRKLYAIAEEIRRDWRPVHYTAKPYLDAMMTLSSLTDSYYYDKADGVVRYFLCNSGTWKGEKARQVKAELKSMLKEFDKKRK